MKLREPLVIGDRLVEEVAVEIDYRSERRDLIVRYRYAKKRKANGEWYAQAHYVSSRDFVAVPENVIPDILLQHAEQCRKHADKFDEKALDQRLEADQAEAQARSLIGECGHSFVHDGRTGFGVGDPLRSCELCGLDESETL